MLVRHDFVLRLFGFNKNNGDVFEYEYEVERRNLPVLELSTITIQDGSVQAHYFDYVDEENVESKTSENMKRRFLEKIQDELKPLVKNLQNFCLQK